MGAQARRCKGRKSELGFPSPPAPLRFGGGWGEVLVFRQRMVFQYQRLEPFIQHMRIDLGCGDVGVAQ